MKIADAYGNEKFGLSFELFPPKTAAGERAMFRHLDELLQFRPSFVTCTYGAGGSTRNKTLDIVQQVGDGHGCAVASHLTCVGSTTDQLRDYLREADRRGVDNIVALRGDPPQGETEFKAVAGGLRHANELVALIRDEFPHFGVAVAGYPETHREAPSPEADLANLKRKVDTGSHAVLTQLFYDNDDFFRFHEACQRIGIAVPVVPGILPVTNLAQVQRIASLCGACVPDSFLADLSACGEDTAAQFEVGVAFARRQVQELLDAGVPGIHFYVLNKSQATAKILSQLDLHGRQ